MKKFILLLTLLSLSVISPEAKAQYLWHSAELKGYLAQKNVNHWFERISCFGDKCIAYGILSRNYMQPEDLAMICQSTDGGRTWSIIDTGFVDEDGSGNRTKVIEQIDAGNAVLIDKYRMFHTFDGGKTWNEQRSERLDSVNYVLWWDVHFSDSLTGIAITEYPGDPLITGTIDTVLITSDGGRHWNFAWSAPHHFRQCHSYGAGKFRVFTDSGIVFTTYNNWKKVQISKPLYDDKFRSDVLLPFFIGNSDTMIVEWNKAVTLLAPFYKRSTMLEYLTWDSLIIPVAGGPYWGVDAMSSLDRDTVIAFQYTGWNKITISTDRGATWKLDTSFLIDTAFNMEDCNGLTFANNNVPVGIFLDSGASNIIAYGVQAQSKVENYEYLHYHTFIYPNPASSDLIIQSSDFLRPIHIYDILGREVLHGMTSSEGRLTLNVSDLPQGVYSILIDHFGPMILLGKIVVMGK